MKRLLIRISYDGTNYHGWQYQPNAITVQQVINESLEKMLKRNVNVTGCSRTDAGVHAKDFCFHIDCEDNIPPKAFLFGLNSILPNDIAVNSVEEVKSDFHARYDVLYKTYQYHFYLGTNDPFLSRYSLRLEKQPDVNLMNEFCKTIIGKFDFMPFSSSGRTVEETVRTVKECYVESVGKEIVLTISADGFLYNMVRIIAGTALAVGYEKLDKNCAKEIFNTQKRELAGETLSPVGLFLKKVVY